MDSDVPRRPTGRFVLWLAFFPPALGLVGIGVGYEIAANPWAAGGGFVGGFAAGQLFVRDFLRWRVSPLTVAALAALLLAFFVAYGSTG